MRNKLLSLLMLTSVLFSNSATVSKCIEFDIPTQNENVAMDINDIVSRLSKTIAVSGSTLGLTVFLSNVVGCPKILSIIISAVGSIGATRVYDNVISKI